MDEIEQNRQIVQDRIARAKIAAKRDKNSVQLLAVSKTFPIQDIAKLYHYGQRDFGENYIQEWQKKADLLRETCPDLVWHIIGHIQSNKTRVVAEMASWVHTLDRIKIAQRLNAQRPPYLPPLQVCIEINISGSQAKHGLTPEAMLPLAEEIMRLPNLNLRGLMCVASPEPLKAKQEFQTMQQLLQQLREIVPQADTLSMGMSGDLEEAILCGATIVRIGSAIFGRRN